MKSLFILILSLIGIVCSSTITAQTEYEPESLYKNDSLPKLKLDDLPIDMSFVFKTSHLWRGLDSSPSPLFCTDLSIADKNKMFRVGFWNGLGTNGVFKEFNNYFSFSKSGFTFEFWDIYNFSTDAKHNNKEFFNYKAKETGRFWDTFVRYRLPGKLPFQFTWSTIIFGRDRGPLNEYNRYSTYVEIEYPIYRSNIVNLDLGIGGAFALRKGKNEEGKKTNAHFYGSSAGVTNVSLKATTEVEILNYGIPVSAYFMWNPEGNNANVQVAFTLFSF